ncbi:MAG: hypothetical protein DWQ19_12755 [Crenarchaeota archaeon]|nr:MAG: hypothetical protein DWQ19_12755 [Thermoproteota archaeon]
MRQFQIKILDHQKYLVRYKVTTPGKFEIFLNEDEELAGLFDEDDCIINMCKNKFDVELIEPFPEKQDKHKQEELDALNWM